VLEDLEVQRYGPDGLLIPPEAPPPRQDDGGEGVPPPSLTRRLETLDFPASGMIPQDLEGSESEDQYLSLGEVHRKAELSADRHRWLITYYSRLVDPLNHLVLVLLGVPTLFLRGTRNVFLSALVAVAIATVYFVVHSVILYLGSRQALHPALASWLAPMAFGALGLTMFRWLRT
jgi:lipopolysaccharide export LptBFGC system permease protein LptF